MINLRVMILMFIVVHLVVQVSAYLISLDDRVVPTHPGYARSLERRVAVAHVITAVVGAPFSTLLWSMPLRTSGAWSQYAASVYTHAWPIWMLMNTAVWAIVVRGVLRRFA